jgi:DNA-binding NarL/FixJ family response regulator
LDKLILLLTMHKKKEFIQQAMAAGADGYLLKEGADTELLKAVKTIREGNKFISLLLSSELADLVTATSPTGSLTMREKELLRHVAGGTSSQEIARIGNFAYLKMVVSAMLFSPAQDLES